VPRRVHQDGLEFAVVLQLHLEDVALKVPVNTGHGGKVRQTDGAIADKPELLVVGINPAYAMAYVLPMGSSVGFEKGAIVLHQDRVIGCGGMRT
jgi:hypothetical protein